MPVSPRRPLTGGNRMLEMTKRIPRGVCVLRGGLPMRAKRSWFHAAQPRRRSLGFPWVVAPIWRPGTPELRLKDGRVIRDIEDALDFAREQEGRPGVDQRDEVLHKMERAENTEEAHAAA